jgi:putative spermidine/putrescine transport system permease protein
VSRSRRFRYPGLWAFAALVGLWMVAPALIVLPMSFTGVQTFQFPPPSWSTRWYSAFFTDPAWYRSLLTSLEVALLVTVLATVLGTAAALGLSRGRFPGKLVVRAFILSPIIVPVVVVAIGVYAVFLSWNLSGSVLGLVLAHTSLAVPFVVVTVSASLATFDRSLERAAASLGANPLVTFLRVTLPNIRAGVLVGALFAFITSFDELVEALFLVSPLVRTLPVQMYASVTREVDPTLAASSTMILLFTTALLMLALVKRPDAA